jgi:hypothetical protein
LWAAHGHALGQGRIEKYWFKGKEREEKVWYKGKEEKIVENQQ